MSAKHTPHSLRIGDQNGEYLGRPRIQLLFDVTYVEGCRPTTYIMAEVGYPTAAGKTVGTEQRYANATRLAACWNACLGIEDPAELRRQRDELLEVVSLLHFRCMGEVPDERNLPALAKAAYENATKGTK